MIPDRARAFRAVLTVLILVVLSPMISIAAESASPPPLTTSLSSALQMVFGLGIVLLAIAGMVWLLRRLAPGQMGGVSELRVVAAVAVGPKERVVLVDVGEQRLVLGVAPGQVTKLSEMPRPATDDIVSAPVPPFVIKLKEMLAKRRSEP